MLAQMKQSLLLIRSLAASVVVAVAIWALLGAPPHQNSMASFIVAWRH